MPFSGFKDLNPAFAASLQQYFAANPGLGAYSGYRDIEHQRRLWNASDKTGHSVARPGHSQHNFGRAADLEYNGVRLDRLPKAQQAALHKSAAEYGLNFRMGHEPWHVELLGTRSGTAPTSASTTSVGDTAAVLANATTPPEPRYEFSKLAQDATDRLAGGRNGNDPVLRETPTGGETPPLETALVSGLDNVPETRDNSTLLSNPLTPLAELFQVKTIGQAGTPQLPGRRF